MNIDRADVSLLVFSHDEKENVMEEILRFKGIDEKDNSIRKRTAKNRRL